MLDTGMALAVPVSAYGHLGLVVVEGMRKQEDAMHIAGTGCVLMDYLYTDVDFSAVAFRALHSRRPGDGGLHPGGLVFAEDLERFAGRSMTRILPELVGDRPADGQNLGGPAVVAMVHAAQLLQDSGIPARFYGARGDDATGKAMMSILDRTPLCTAGLGVKPGVTPATVVLSDPRHHDGKGERTFINSIGAAGHFEADDLDADFFAATLQLYGGTALIPGLHDALLPVLARAQANGAFTVVATVFDFRNQQRHPDRPWPLGDSVETYRHVDLLIVDHEEALKLSGCDNAAAAARRFADWGTGAVIVTRGAQSMLAWSSGARIAPLPLCELPVCAAADEDLAAHPERRGDTTGCGDNFVGGTIAALAARLQRGAICDLPTACAWGAASGGLACFHLGGTYIESRPGEKRDQVAAYVQAYAKQVGSAIAIATDDL